MKYKTEYEKDMSKAIVMLIIGMVMLIPLFIDLITGNEIYDSFGLSIAFWFGIIMFLRSYIPMKTHEYHLKKGTPYPGKIMYAETIMGEKSSYYLLVEFCVKGKKLIRRTGAYSENPNWVLSSRNCTIYEYNGKYMEGNFQTKERRDRFAPNFIKVNVVGRITKKSRKYV